MNYDVALLDDGTNEHIACLGPLWDTLVNALRDLGHTVRQQRWCEGFYRVDHTTIFLGAHLWVAQGHALPEDCIIYNTEQTSSSWFTTAYMDTLFAHDVWDYTGHNDLTYLGFDVSKVPLGYHHCLEHVKHLPEAERDIDILFFGSINERRSTVLDQLAQSCTVVRLFGVYGADLDEYLARAKLVINIHFYGQGTFESIRVNYCVANGIPVISETSAPEAETPLCLEVPYTELAVEAYKLVIDSKRRAILARENLDKLRARPMVGYVADAIRGDKPKAKVALCMIVKNESHIIHKALNSVKPFIGAWCVSDTGSTDGTQAIVQELLAPMPGVLLQEPWIQEDLNRNRSLAVARALGEYVLWIDADETFEPSSRDFVLGKLEADAYSVIIRYGTFEYWRWQIIKSDLPWAWKGRVHPDLAVTEGVAADIRIMTGVKTIPDPAGSSWADPDKFKKHAALLEADLVDYPGNPRMTYYLAQSYRDAQMFEEALWAYTTRSLLEAGWVEERWSALYEAAKIMEYFCTVLPETAPSLKHCEPWHVLGSYLDAFKFRPTRAEPLYRLGRFHRIRGEFHLALLYLSFAARMPMPPDGLFVETAAYQWQITDELLLAAYYTGDKELARLCLKKLRRVASIPEADRLRIEAGARFLKDP